VKMEEFANGRINYDVISSKPADSTQSSGDFEISEFVIESVDYAYLLPEGAYRGFISRANASLDKKGPAYHILLSAITDIHEITSGEDTYFEQAPAELELDLVYQDSLKQLVFTESTVRSADALLEVNGTVGLDQKTVLDLEVSAKRTTISGLLALGPLRVRERMAQYRSDGHTYFDAVIQGPAGGGEQPRVTVDFGCRDARFYHPKFNREIRNLSFTGLFTNGQARTSASSKLTLQGITGKFDGKELKADVEIVNFDRLTTTLNFSGELDVESLLEFFPNQEVREGDGMISTQLYFKGSLRDLKKSVNMNQLRTSGELNLQEVGFRLSRYDVPFENLTGSFIFNNNDVAISDFSGQVGKSDFRMDGFFRNVINYFFVEGKKLEVVADLDSKLIDLDELLAPVKSAADEEVEKDTTTVDGLRIPRLVNLIFRCQIGKIKLDRFSGRSIRGELKLQDGKAIGRDLSMKAAGGTMALNGFVDNSRNENHLISATTKLDGIYIDSVFYIFNDFKQEFLSHQNLSGQLDATVVAHMGLTKNLGFNNKAFDADIDFAIKNGELRNFEPMERIQRMIKSGDLSRLTFSDIENKLIIAGETIFIPPMTVSTNVTTIEMEGTHTFANAIEYRLKIPLSSFMKPDKDAAYGAIETSSRGKGNLFIKISGTTEDYKISYDTERVKQKIKSDIKQEGQEFLDAIKNENQNDTPVPELSEDDYFDF